eukprot:m.80529 g.80529  ORF g.80529 m.80529 type:complete len:142 (-) comp8623_c1_seq1:826-1251(-)
MVRFKSRYFLASINLEKSAAPWKEINQKFLKKELLTEVRHQHGDFGVGSVQASFAVKYYCDTTKHCIVRCAREFQGIVRTSLQRVNRVQEYPCSIRIHHEAGTIRSCQKALVKHNKKHLRYLLANCKPSERSQIQSSVPLV